MEYSPTHADELRGSFEGVVRVVQAADEVEDVPWHVHEVRQQVVNPRRGRGRRRVRWLSLCHSSVVVVGASEQSVGALLSRFGRRRVLVRVNRIVQRRLRHFNHQSIMNGWMGSASCSRSDNNMEKNDDHG